MRTRFGWWVFVMVVSAVTISARVPTQRGDRPPSSETGGACRSHDSADNAAAKGLGPALVEARTVYLISEFAQADNARSLDELRHELQRWHRWEEVSRRDAADVTLSIGLIRGEGGGATLTLGIRARQTNSVLWASSGRDVAAAFKALEDRLPSLESACAPIQVL